MKHDRGNTLVQQTTTLAEIRSEAARRAAAMEWPAPSDEYWRRTDISGLEFESRPVATGTPTLEAGIPEAVSLQPVGAGSEPPLAESSAALLRRRVAAARDRVEAFHLSRLSSGIVLDIPAGVILEEPLIIRFQGQSGAHEASFAHIRAGRGSAAQLFFILEEEADAESLRTSSFHFELDDGSALTAAVLQDISVQSHHFAFHTADIASDASLSFSEIDLGAGVSVSAPIFSTRGEGASVDITGLYAVDGGQHKNMRPVQHHAAPHGTSNSLYKGALVPGARTVFQGLIRVEPGAVKTDAYLSNKNLLMDDGARADSIPSLQILNNDVRCTHGSTTGKLDPEQVFYLQSRGFAADEAERMLLWGFYRDALRKLPEGVTAVVEQRLSRHPLFRGR